MRIAAFFLACVLLPLGAHARDEGVFEKDDSITIEPGMAYFLVRQTGQEDFGIGPLLVRVLSAEELKAALERRTRDHGKEEPNALALQTGKPYAESGGEEVLLTSARPGTYILAGEVFGHHGFVETCLCLGTVQFEAKAGMITDLGTILIARDDKPAPFPELAGRTRSKRIGISPTPVVMGVRPYHDSMFVPDTLARLPRAAAEYRAKGPFPNYFGAPIDRLAPIPGILDYDKDGRMVDLRSPK